MCHGNTRTCTIMRDIKGNGMDPKMGESFKSKSWSSNATQLSIEKEWRLHIDFEHLEAIEKKIGMYAGV